MRQCLAMHYGQSHMGCLLAGARAPAVSRPLLRVRCEADGRGRRGVQATSRGGCLPSLGRSPS
jgi:hypothetical protein